ncbi:hypothetical protein FORC065_1109 [Yersinia enterocolitica]|nr:hypothetical protein FORC065_1109 [Yersinia enterocolitica]
MCFINSGRFASPYAHIVLVSRHGLLLLKSVRQRCALEFNNLL